MYKLYIFIISALKAQGSSLYAYKAGAEVGS